MTSIDVIVPTYRLQSKYLVPILQIDTPLDTKVRFIVVADNPAIEIPPEVASLTSDNKVILMRNVTNLGVCETRNTGIEHATADWVLFIDDDVVPEKNLLIKYTEAIKEFPDEVGFFGNTIFPEPVNAFTGGLAASVILAFFTIGRKMHRVKWVPTPNVMIKRAAIGNIRFDTAFDKFGAGEEIDFFLRIYKTTAKELRFLENAPVYHDWWHGGKRTYSRFSRWAGGFTILIDKFPEYTFFSFPNIAETLLLGLLITLPVCVYIQSVSPLVGFLGGIIMGECSGECLNIIANKGFARCIYAPGVVLVRGAMDAGKMSVQLKRGKLLSHFCKCFDHFCDGKRIWKIRFWAGLKFGTCVFFTVLFCYLLLR